MFVNLSGPSIAGAPNRPLPPTPDEDPNERTLIMKRVSHFSTLHITAKRIQTHKITGTLFQNKDIMVVGHQPFFLPPTSLTYFFVGCIVLPFMGWTYFPFL